MQVPGQSLDMADVIAFEFEARTVIAAEIAEKIPKFMVPMFKEHISGRACRAGASRWSRPISELPPVEIFRIASQPRLIAGRKA